MASDLGYQDVIRAIVEEERKTVGILAVKRASRLDELEEDDGELLFVEEPDSSTVESLLEVYEEFQGKGSTAIARRAMEDTLDNDFDLDLPPKIIPRKISQERFVKGF